MSEFERLLAAYRAGRMDLEALQTDVERLVAGSNGAATDALVVLEAAHADGLREAAYLTLRRQLTARSSDNATILSASRSAPLDDSTTAMYRGLGVPEGPTELNPAAGYSNDEIARRREVLAEAADEPGEQGEQERAEPTITDMGVVASGEEPTGTMWPGLYDDGVESVPEREFQQGEILRGRFKLVSKLGEGGMGAVWKGKDLLKEEAKDRNPYVAIKLLQADFKKHPEAFIALQRETSKQQRLAHPNIATVYDFDRDERTQTVFMTMEVMEGQPLDAFIRALPPGGLPVEEAMGIIEQLAAGLAYAHANGLVHSDLKPGNCFITSDETVKLLDFGIARASKSKVDAEGETTLFDPAELGALTPTYATLEMFEGEDPDPRDDIFALAILAYQLLTGRHPYGKKSAPKAKALGLRPARIGKLSKRQNRGLAKGLALEREQRTASVEAFLNDIRRRHSTATYVVTGTLVASLLIAALAYKPVLDLHNRRQHEEIIAELERPGMENIRDALAMAASLGDEGLQRIMEDERTKRAITAHIGLAGGERLDQWLTLVRTFPTELQRDILDDERARTSIVDDFERRIFTAFDPARRRYDFARAHQHVSTLETLYPDSAAALKIRTELESRRDNALDRLGDRFNRYLDAGLLMPEDGREYIGDVLDAVRRMAPTHHLLYDDRLRLRYGELADAARRSGDYERAAALVRAGLEYAPDDPALRDLRYQVETELTRIANRQRVSDIESRLATLLPSRARMSDYEAHHDDLLALTALAPDSPTLSQVRTRLATAMSEELRRLFEGKDYDQAWQLLVNHAPLLDLDYLRAARERLPWETSLAAHRDDSRIDEHVDSISTLLAQPLDGGAQRAALEREFKQLVILLPTSHATVHEQRDRIADHFLLRARRAREEGSFEEALAFIESGRFFYPDYPPFEIESRMLARARAELRARRNAERMAALKTSMKAEFRSKAETNQVQEAKSILLELRAEDLADDDPFVREEAPHLLADAYARLAASRATRQDFAGAISLAEAGLKQWPQHDELRARLAGYEIARENQRFETALRRRLADPNTLDVAATEADLARLEARFPNRYAQTATELAALRRLTVLDYARSAEPIGDRMAAHLSAYSALFPVHRRELAGQLIAIASERIGAQSLTSVEEIEALRPALDNIAALPADERSRLQAVVAESVIAGIRLRASQDAEGARQLIATARELLAAEDSLLAVSRELPMPEIERARANLREAKLSAAARDLDAAVQEDPGHPEIQALRADVEAAMRAARQAYEHYVDDIAGAEAHEQRQFDQRHDGIAALWSDNPEFKRLSISARRKGECHDALAGYGAQAGGSCYDMVAGRKGPEMVVVPPGNGLAKAFAIGKYEVSVNEFNHFCERSGRCTARTGGERRLPVTNITIAEAEAYARWLSAEASRQAGHPVSYRLPTAAEWHHAATAGGQQPERKFNCRVFAAGEVIAGHELVDARSGKQNGWGLANYAGNAREWVRVGQGLAVRGGAYDDPLTECGPEHNEAHSGQADELTGFRLVRELG